MKLRKVTALCMTATIMAAAILTGCGTEEKSAEKTENKEAAEEKKEEGEISRPKITVATTINEADMKEENYALNWVEEQTGVDIELVFLPSSDAETKVNLMLASDECPDVICYDFTRQKTFEYGEEGVFIPINDLYEKYGDNLKKLYEARPEYKSISYAPDGNMYGFLHYHEGYHEKAYPKLWYNKKWLDDLGIKEPKTTDEFEEMLKAVKASDYNGNGKADEIPLTGNIDAECQVEWVLMNYFIATNKYTLANSKDGKVDLAVDKDEFRQGLEWMHKLYEEGLIDPSCFSQDNDQMQQVIRSDNKRVFAYTADHFAMGVDMNVREDNEATYAMVPVESPTGARYQQNTEFADKSSKFHWFITDACKNPEAAFKVGDFLMGDEASLICCFGPEGTFWGELEEEKDSIIGGYKAKYWTNPDFSSDANSQAEKGHMYLGMHNDLTEFRASYTEMPEDLFTPDSYEARLIVETQKLEPYFYEEYIPKLNILLEGEEAETFNDLRGTLQEYVKTAMAQFITGERNIEKEWDSYVEEVHAYDSDTYVELLQKARDLYMGE